MLGGETTQLECFDAGRGFTPNFKKRTQTKKGGGSVRGLTINNPTNAQKIKAQMHRRSKIQKHKD